MKPFAKPVALRYSDSGGQTYGVEVLGFKLAGNFNETGAMLRAMGINARVDEEERKAVEKFRERAAKSCADHFGSREGKEYGDALASMIRTLPTEPERGKE